MWVKCFDQPFKNNCVLWQNNCFCRQHRNRKIVCQATGVRMNSNGELFPGVLVCDVSWNGKTFQKQSELLHLDKRLWRQTLFCIWNHVHWWAVCSEMRNGFMLTFWTRVVEEIRCLESSCLLSLSLSLCYLTVSPLARGFCCMFTCCLR